LTSKIWLSLSFFKRKIIRIYTLEKKKSKIFSTSLSKNGKISPFKKTLVWALLGTSLCLALAHKMGWPLFETLCTHHLTWHYLLARYFGKIKMGKVVARARWLR
jgi:hypothetical protein